MKLLSNHDSILKAHLESPRLRNAKYISTDIQNQIIEIIRGMIIQKDIVNEVLHAKHYSILVDEITSHNQELMPLVVRFVDKNYTIREEFLKFSSLTKLTGEAITSVVNRDLEGLGLDICNIRGQGYDGASNMFSSRIGLQACIRLA